MSLIILIKKNHL